MKKAAWSVILWAGVSSAALAQGADELWDMTIRMDMAGKNGKAPEFHQQVCQPKGNAFKPESMPKQQGDNQCEVVDLNVSGNTTSWKVRCVGAEKAEGSGRMTRTADSMEGVMKMSLRMQGQAFEVTQNVSGKRVGTCDFATEQKKLEAQAKAATQGMQQRQGTPAKSK